MKKNGFALLLIILVIAILGVVGYFGYEQFLSPSTSPITIIPENLISDKNIYKDDVNGFSFMVPDGFPLSTDRTTRPASNTTVSIFKTSDLPDEEIDAYTITKGDSETLIGLLNESVSDKNKIRLLNFDWGWGLAESTNIINKGNHNVFYNTTFASYDECSFTFHHEIAFAIKGGFVRISIAGDSEKYKTILPKYIFKENDSDGAKSYCFKESYNGYNIDGMSELYSDLVNNQSEINKEVVEWFNSLNTVVNSLEFTK